MPYPNVDASELFADRESQRSAMHTRHLNEQTGARAQDDRLRRRVPSRQRPVSVRSRRRPLSRPAERLRRVRASAAIIRRCARRSRACSTASCPISCRWTSRRSPAFWPSGCCAHVPYLDKVFFANSGAESVEAAIKFARAATGRAGHRLLRPRLPRPDLRRAVAERRRDLPRRLRAAAARLHRASRSTISPRWSRRCRRATIAAFIVEPIQGKGVNMPADDYLQGAAELCRKLRHAVRRRRDPDRPRAAPAASSRSSTGTSSPTWCCWRRRCPAATCRSARC